MKNKLKELFKSKQLIKGSYSSILIVIIVAIIIALNIMVEKLPTAIKNIDISSTNIYAIGDVTEGVIQNLNSNIDITVIAETDSVDTRIQTLLSKYDDASNYITVTYKDPALYPSILTTYNTTKDTIVVYCQDTEKSTLISFDDIIVSTINYTTYTSEESEFDGEGQLTTAIDYVSNDTNNIIYTTEGHGETSLGDTITEAIQKSNFSLNTINLITEDFPEDCSTLIMNMPTADITENELDVMDNYMEAGGNIIILLSDSTEETPNLDKFMETYGIVTTDTYIGDMGRAVSGGNSAFVCVPEYSSGDITSGFDDDDMVLVVNSVGIQAIDVEDVTFDEFLITSEQGVSYVDGEEDYETGNYTFAIAAEKIDSELDDVTSHLTVYGCSSIIDDNYDSTSTFKNTDVFLNSITVNYEDVNNISIASISLETAYNSYTNIGIYKSLFVFIIPTFFIVIGFMRWFYRRKL